eukprot:7305002-Prymnesium_polylepis.1
MGDSRRAAGAARNEVPTTATVQATTHTYKITLHSQPSREIVKVFTGFYEQGVKLKCSTISGTRFFEHPKSLVNDAAGVVGTCVFWIAAKSRLYDSLRAIEITIFHRHDRQIDAREQIRRIDRKSALQPALRLLRLLQFKQHGSKIAGSHAVSAV